MSRYIPITFTDHLARLVENGTKTQTRRVVGRGTPKCRYGEPGDILYVRQNWRTLREFDSMTPRQLVLAHGSGVGYVPVFYGTDGYPASSGRHRAAMHMPKSFSRTRLLVTSIRAERVQLITHEDAIAEGVRSVGEFSDVWDAINLRRGWGWVKNPLTWVVEFVRER